MSQKLVNFLDCSSYLVSSDLRNDLGRNQNSRFAIKWRYNVFVKFLPRLRLIVDRSLVFSLIIGEMNLLKNPSCILFVLSSCYGCTAWQYSHFERQITRLSHRTLFLQVFDVILKFVSRQGTCVVCRHFKRKDP